MLSKVDISLIAGLALAAAISIICGFGMECGEVREEVLRLHILADSDSDGDQRVKLAVRDAVLEQFGDSFALCAGLAEAKALAVELLPEIEACANLTLYELGSADAAHAELAEGYFDTREYGEGHTLPAGDYCALRIVIGAGAGHNWWCVMFPPVCVGAACNMREVRDIEALSESATPELRFATVELMEKLLQRWK